MAKTRITPQPSHENTVAYALRKADALKRFDVNKEAMRMARRRARMAEYRKKVT